MGSLLGDVARWVIEVVHTFGYVGEFVLTVVGSLAFPPTELTLPLVGFLVGQGRFSFVPALSTAIAARATTSLLLYFLGAQMGEERLRQLVERPLERSKLLFSSDLDKASEVFERHGGKAILLGQLLPGVGAWISVPAGLKHMPIRWRFTGYTLLGSTLWVGSFIVLGWSLGNEWEIVGSFASIVGYAVLAAVVVGVLGLLWRRWWMQE